MTRVRSLARRSVRRPPAAGVAACGSDGDDGPKNVSAKTAALGTISPACSRWPSSRTRPTPASRATRSSAWTATSSTHVAEKLGLEVEPEVTDFAGMLAGVQSRRVDITIGGVAWTADRQKQGLFTDPPYYSPPAMAVRAGKTYQTVDDLKGLELGTVEGYVWVKSIQAVPGAKLHAYPDANGVFDDLGAGRIDVGFLDPLLIIAAQKERPELKIETQYLTPPTAAQVKASPPTSTSSRTRPASTCPRRPPSWRRRSPRRSTPCTRTARWRSSSRSTAATPSSSSSPPPTSPPRAGAWTGPPTGHPPSIAQ